MNPFRLPQHNVSACFWRTVGDARWPSLPPVASSRVPLRQNLAYLAQICAKLRPESVVEIGAGASTEIMLKAGVTALWTCDRDNCGRSIPGATVFDGESTDMLRGLVQAVDLFFFDGRLHADDFAEVRRLSRPDTWYVFDDFHGLEKGVMNAAGLSGEGRYLMVPCDGAVGRSTLAVLAPVAALSLGVYG